MPVFEHPANHVGTGSRTTDEELSFDDLYLAEHRDASPLFRIVSGRSDPLRRPLPDYWASSKFDWTTTSPTASASASKPARS
jgi:hypothetical protein